jgi:5-methylcytosine-specific restriction endonuclease McrA
VLNADYSFLNMVDWRRAVCLLVKNKVKVLKYSGKVVLTGEGMPVRVPLVIKLIKFIRMVYRSRVPFSKKNVFLRDRHTCAYCGRKPKALTLDHVIPSSRGGKTDFDNCVACCASCNSRKGARTPREAGMHLSKSPYQPTYYRIYSVAVAAVRSLSLVKGIGDCVTTYV